MQRMKTQMALAGLAAAIALRAQAPDEAVPPKAMTAKAAAPTKIAAAPSQIAAAPSQIAAAPSKTKVDPALAMEQSIARQRAAVAKQAGQTAQGGFFVLAPPARMGATVAAITPLADCDPLPASEVDSLVQQSAQKQGLDEQVLRSVIQQESAFRPCAVSAKGAMGLMQLMPATASQFGVPDPFNPADNVEAGAAFLKQLLGRYGGDLNMALGAYNAGPAKVDAAAGVPKIPETQDYVNRVLSTIPVKK